MNGDYLLLLLFIICLALSAFFSSSEVALISITRAKVRTLVNEGKKGSVSLSELKEKPNRFLVSILIGNNIVNIAAAAIATAVSSSPHRNTKWIDVFPSPGLRPPSPQGEGRLNPSPLRERGRGEGGHSSSDPTIAPTRSYSDESVIFSGTMSPTLAWPALM